MTSLFAQDMLETCTACHSSAKTEIFSAATQTRENADMACYDCHYALAEGEGMKALPRLMNARFQRAMRKKQTYLMTKPLIFQQKVKSGGTVNKYTRDGLKTFLQSPVSRNPALARNAMYPLSEQQLTLVLKEADRYLSQSPSPAPQSLLSQGQSLFKTHCQQCHTPSNHGPLLRLGYPLLSAEYFTQSVVGQVEGLSNLMPSFAETLSHQETQALYAYVSQANDDVGIDYKESYRVEFLLPDEVYHKLLVPVFSTSCRHCHARSQEEQAPLKKQFGTTNMNFLLYRTQKGYEPTKDSLHFLLPTQDCKTPPLLQRFEARVAEWKGDYTQKLVGMPLTLQPLNNDVLAKYRLWVAGACIIDGKKQCEPCASI
ncbi:MAG: cytochrome c [Pseudomonadota bacterium]